jgi:hypothetical protein
MTTSGPGQSPAEVLGGQVGLRSLSDHDVERVARRTVELLAESARDGHRRCVVDAAYIAERFGVERAWVHQHKLELGAMPMGRGSRPRLRFEVTRVEAFFHELRATRFPPPRKRGRPRKRTSESGLVAVATRGR